MPDAKRTSDADAAARLVAEGVNSVRGAQRLLGVGRPRAQALLALAEEGGRKPAREA